MIGDAKYYLGSYIQESNQYPGIYTYGTADEIYKKERGTDVYSVETMGTAWPCYQSNFGTWPCIVGSLNWVGKVGLMYQSDLVFNYSNNIDKECCENSYNCRNSVPENGWIYLDGLNIIQDGYPIDGRGTSEFLLTPNLKYHYQTYSILYLLDYYHNYELFYSYHNVSEYGGVRPVLYLKSNVSVVSGNGREDNPFQLAVTSNENRIEEEKNNYYEYKIGDEILYDNELYYVLNDSDKKKSYVTLIKADLLTRDEVNSYSDNYVSQDGEYPYYESETCNEANNSECYSKYYEDSNIIKNVYYADSMVKKIVDKWALKYDSDLQEVYGFKSRIINSIDIFKYLKYGNQDYNVSESTPFWASVQGKKYWSMIPFKRYDFSQGYRLFEGKYGVGDSLSEENVYNKLYIRPVINLKKCAIDNSCQ